jgi:hypothetical protein
MALVVDVELTTSWPWPTAMQKVVEGQLTP